ncbi:uncharacterized protein LOC142317666 [Lycorma delicatula]|uniref:uncharacterized protein LOC142317666 n=1 Tax=Lycorma delicatula TaxID=130591 RepID=UPI003F519BE3
MKQKSTVKIDENLTNWLESGRGVRQCCCLSPTLFTTLYDEEILKGVLDGQKKVSIRGRNINCVRFVDDLLTVSKDTQTLQGLIKGLEVAMKKYGMKINVTKTKFMKMTERENMGVVTTEGKIVSVKTYRYLLFSN